MLMKARRVLTCGILAFLFCANVIAQDEEKLPCGVSADLLRDKQGEVVWFKSKELSKRATHRVTDIARILHGKGTIFIALLIDSEGKVKCAKGISGPTLWLEHGVKRAEKWKFKPMEVEGKAVSFYGLLGFRIHYGSFIVIE